MTVDQALKIRTFSINWLTKVVAKRKDYLKRLMSVVNDIIPENIERCDGYGILDVENWDTGKYCGMTDIIYDYPEGFYSPPSKNLMNDISCAFRIAIDLYIEQSGGVIGYSIGDLKKAFDGTIPDEINELYESDINEDDESMRIWL